jgi:GMP synthase (glutamine-hydrolysing)
MTRKLALIRHGDEPDDDRVHSFALMNGLQPQTFRPFRGDALPDLTPDVVGTVIFGGKQAAEDDANCPYLAQELAWIAACRAADLPMLGICLGAQLIIRSLGGRVGALQGDLHEFGYYPIAATAAGADVLPQTLHVTEAHFHTFTLPAGVELLATGANYPHEAFRVGPRIYGVQFHPECTIEIFRRWQYARLGASGQTRRAIARRTMPPDGRPRRRPGRLVHRFSDPPVPARPRLTGSLTPAFPNAVHSTLR